jgi:hypothetical protein
MRQHPTILKHQIVALKKKNPEQQKQKTTTKPQKRDTPHSLKAYTVLRMS